MENKYGITKATPSLPAIDLLRVPHKGKTLIVGYPAFGPNSYKDNLESVSRKYFHSKEIPKISFRPATTSESISIASYKFGEGGEFDAKRDIFDPRWLQASYIVRTSDGVFMNTKETNESTLKSMLDKCEKVNGIYLGENDFAFADYKSFKQGVQNYVTFCKGGLARALEYTDKKVAENLRTITSPKNYKKGVNVWGFDKSAEPILRVATLSSGRILGDGRLGVDGINCVDFVGFAFGVALLRKANNGARVN